MGVKQENWKETEEEEEEDNVLYNIMDNLISMWCSTKPLKLILTRWWLIYTTNLLYHVSEIKKEKRKAIITFVSTHSHHLLIYTCC